MIPLCSAARVRALDGAVISGLGVPGLVLMELAGRGAAEAVHRRWPAATVAVVCGPGNNGGDGWVIARWLALWGHRVRVAEAMEARTPDAIANRDLAHRMGLAPVPLADALQGADLVVDALLGTGQSAAPRGTILEAVQGIRLAGRPVVAVDLPTGMDADTGQLLGGPDAAVPARLTLTFGRIKPGLLCEPGSSLAGEVGVVDIGLDLGRLHDPGLSAPDAWLLEAADVDGWLPRVPAGAAKWHRGHVAVRAGRGAAVLASHGAFRAGAGLVTLLAPRQEWAALSGLWPEVILAEPDALDPARHDAVVLGPGLGLDALDAVELVWSAFPGAVVADADALTLLARDWRPPPDGAVRVITPHSAEAARLLGTTRAAVDADRFRAVRELRTFGLPLLKGPNSLVGAELPWVLPFRDARLATAGSGDVLAGMVAAMLARGLEPARAAAAAAFLHGQAGTRMPEHGTASDLVAAITPRPQ